MYSNNNWSRDEVPIQLNSVDYSITYMCNDIYN